MSQGVDGLEHGLDMRRVRRAMGVGGRCVVVGAFGDRIAGVG